MTADVSGPVALLVAIVLVIAYFVPALVAFVRNVPNRGSILVVNLFLGWTVIGWIVALAMAAGNKQPRSHV